MSLYRHLLRSLRSSDAASTKTPAPSSSIRPMAFSSGEEAAAASSPPSTPAAGPQRSPPPRLPASTSALVGPRLSLHNRVQTLIRSGNLYLAATAAGDAVFSRPRPTVFTCSAVMAAMLRAGRLDDVERHFAYFYHQSNIVPNVVSYNILINSHCDSGQVDAAFDVYRHILENAPFSPSPVLPPPHKRVG